MNNKYKANQVKPINDCNIYIKKIITEAVFNKKVVRVFILYENPLRPLKMSQIFNVTSRILVKYHPSPNLLSRRITKNL